MQDFEVNFKGNGVNILKREQLFDAQGNAVTTSNHRQAFGLGDVDGDVNAFQDNVRALLEPVYGQDMANLVSENAASKQALKAREKELESANSSLFEADIYIVSLTMERDSLKAEKEALILEKANIQKELDEERAKALVPPASPTTEETI